jgi:hypothetical protein
MTVSLTLGSPNRLPSTLIVFKMMNYDFKSVLRSRDDNDLSASISRRGKSDSCRVKEELLSFFQLTASSFLNPADSVFQCELR